MLIGDDVGPRKLYRHLEDRSAAINHMRGQLWLTKIEYFRDIEDDERRDAQEGNVSGPVKNGLHISYGCCDPRYILCFTENESCVSKDGVSSKFGDHVIVLRDKRLLRECILRALPKKTNAYWGRIEYSDEVGYQREPGPVELADRAELTKPTRFASENEWRLIVRLPINLRISNTRLKLDLGNLTGILELYPKYICNSE